MIDFDHSHILKRTSSSYAFQSSIHHHLTTSEQRYAVHGNNVVSEADICEVVPGD